MNGQFTIITSKNPSILGKTYKLGLNGLEKNTAGDMWEGGYEVASFSNANDLASLLVKVGTNQAITTSLPLDGSQSGRIVTKAKKAENPCALSRSKSDFGFGAVPGVIALDYDPAPGSIALSKNELWQILCSVVPTLPQGSVVWWCSSSSFIFNGDDEISGLRGQRVYITCADASDTPRFSEVLGQRLWLAGYGRIEISVSGQKLARHVFDKAMAEPARLDYIGGATTIPPLSQKRGMPEILADGSWLDTRAALPDLNSSELEKYRALVDDAKQKAESEARQARATWAEDRLSAGIERLTKVGIAYGEALERIEKSLASALNGVLLGDYEITLDTGEVVTIGQVLDYRERYQGCLTLDPLEPGYLGRKVTGKLYLFGSQPNLHSFAHGGCTYYLRRQPARMYIQRGQKAELVDSIRRFLQNEPDIFVRGGCVVRVEDGRVKLVRKQVMGYILQSRCAFFSKTADGKEVPADLPGDVVDMLVELVGG